MGKRILYVYGGLYIPNGMNAVISQKVNYLAENTDYEVYISLTECPELPHYYKLSDKVKWVNFNINFDVLDAMPIYQKIWHFWWKQRQFRKRLTAYMMEIRPDITVSVCRREINFITKIQDGSKKVAEIHFARTFYRSFNKRYLPVFVNRAISIKWMDSLIGNLRQMERFVVLTEEDKKNWTELDNVVAIPNFISTMPLKRSTLESKRVIAAGRYSFEKGYDRLIGVWKQVHEKHPDWILDIYGAGNNEDYQKMADQMGLSGCLHCFPATSHLYDVFVNSSIFVLTSRHEGFGLVLVEAMASGLSVVSFACPCGPREIISDGEDGFLVVDGDVQEMAEKICYLIEHPEIRHEVANKALAKVSKYSKESVMRLWIDFFGELLK